MTYSKASADAPLVQDFATDGAKYDMFAMPRASRDAFAMVVCANVTKPGGATMTGSLALECLSGCGSFSCG